MYILAFSCSVYTLIYLPPPPPGIVEMTNLSAGASINPQWKVKIKVMGNVQQKFTCITVKGWSPRRLQHSQTDGLEDI